MIAWRLSEKDMRDAFGGLKMRFDDERGRLVTTMALLIATLVVNAFVCGALSGPFARYQARIAWLADLGGILCLASLVPAEATLPAIARRLRAHPLAVAFEQRFDPAFIRFGLVGTAGFLVHATVLHLMVAFVGLNVYVGWLCGFAVAVTTTLLLNRAFTFRRPSHHGPLRQAVIYLLVQGAGAAANFGAYAATLALLPVLRQALVVPLAVGSVAGLCLTFLGSKHLAFRPAKVAGAPSS
jgi:putative flippase GtrA